MICPPADDQPADDHTKRGYRSAHQAAKEKSDAQPPCRRQNLRYAHGDRNHERSQEPGRKPVSFGARAQAERHKERGCDDG